MIEVKLVDSNGKGSGVRVSQNGQMIIAPIAFSIPVQKSLNVDNQVFNLATARVAHRIIITDVILIGDRNIGVNDATVDIYAADFIDSSTIVKSIFSLDVAKNASIVMTGLNMVTDVGVFLNAKSSDSTVSLTVGYYYLPETTETEEQVAT